MQLSSEPPGNCDVPRVCNTTCKKGLRDRRGGALVRLLIGRTRASNEDHTLRHINPAIVRGGSASEARTERHFLFCSSSRRAAVECAAVGILQ